jgi:integrase
MGSLYRPKYPPEGHTYAQAKAAGLLRESAVWWIKYYVGGRPVRESTGTAKEQDARRVLKAREGRVALGQPMLPRVDRILYEEAAADLRRYYETTGCRDLAEADGRLAHLNLFFTGRRLAAIGQAEATDYVLKRQGSGAANGTINRELAVLGRMLRLAYKHGKLLRLPVIDKLKESGPRQGFFERAQYEAVRRRLRPDLQAAVAIAYAFGWRMQSEVLTLERRQLDLEAGTLRLDAGETKNDEGRVVYLTPELLRLLGEQLNRVRTLERETGRIIPCLFPHDRGRHRGERRRDFRKAWAKACRKAGVAGRLRHDLRRTAVRNLVNAGVAERVAMTVTGHKTRAVFDRYHIVSPGDLQDVARKLAGQVSGQVAPAALETRPVSL